MRGSFTHNSIIINPIEIIPAVSRKTNGSWKRSPNMPPSMGAMAENGALMVFVRPI